MQLRYALLAGALMNSSWADVVDFESTYTDIQFMSSARINQQAPDIAGSVTILHRDELLAKGILTIPEALRLVPGMSVVEISRTGRTYKIAYHGGNALVPRRMQVMIDGMSVYLAVLAQIDWHQFPVTVEDIERIEVIRNPSSSTYGANAFNATINIITRHPEDMPRYAISTTLDSRQSRSIKGSHAGRVNDTAYVINASSEVDTGYDNDHYVSIPNYVPNEARDDYRLQKFSFRTDTTLGADHLQLTGGFVDGKYEAEYVTSEQLEPSPDRDTREYHLNGIFTKAIDANREWQIQSYYRRSKMTQIFYACRDAIFFLPESRALALANVDYFNTLLQGGTPSGGSANDDALLAQLQARVTALGADINTSVCGQANQNYVDDRWYIDTEYRHVVSDQWQWVVGGSHEYVRTASETYFNGTVSDNNTTVFFSSEWKPSRRYTINVSGLWEHSDNANAFRFNPRASINTHITPYTTIRVVGSRSYRTPDLAETERDWNYLARQLTPAAIVGGSTQYLPYNANSNNFDALDSEKIDAFEIGLLHQSSNNRYVVDMRIFKDDMSRLISEELGWPDFNLSNNGDSTTQGFEASVHYRWSSQLSMDLAYSYQDHEFDNFKDETLNMRHSGHAFLTYRQGPWVSSIGYIGHNNLSDNSLDRWSLHVGRTGAFSGGHWELSGTLFYQPSDVVYEEKDIGMRNFYGYDDDVSLQVHAKVRF